jgi:hypothetical protein
MGDPKNLVSKYDDLARISSQLARLTEAITSNARAYPDGAIDWKGFRLRLQVQDDAIAARRFRLALAGGNSAERSELVSHFLGRPGLLPRNKRASVVTTIRKGTRPATLVQYWSRSESEEIQRACLAALGVPSSVPIGDGPKAVEALRSKLPPALAARASSYLALRAAHEKYASQLGATQEVPLNPIAPEHAGEPEKHVDLYPHVPFLVQIDAPEPNEPLLRAIKHVVLHVESEHLTDDMEVLDLPGADTTDPIDAYVQQSFLRKADGLAVVTNSKPPLDGQESQVVELRSIQEKVLPGAPLFCVSPVNDVGERALGHFRDEIVRLKLESIVKSLQSLSREVEGALKPRWERAAKEGTKAEQMKIVETIQSLSRLREGFLAKSAKFRKEQILKKSFDKVFEQVAQRLVERVKLHLAGCTEAGLRQEFETVGTPRDPKELLRLFHERAQAAIVDDCARLVWDQRNDVRPPAREGEPPPIPAESVGLLKRLVRDGYHLAVGKDELLGRVDDLLTGDSEERRQLRRIFDELDLCLEVTTQNAVTRETLDLNELVDSLAQGAAGFPDWARRYQQGLAQVITDRLQRSLRNMQTYLWNLFWKHLLNAEARVARFLESDEVFGLVAVNGDARHVPADGTTAPVSPAVLLEHEADWKKLDAAIVSVDQELKG